MSEVYLLDVPVCLRSQSVSRGFCLCDIAAVDSSLFRFDCVRTGLRPNEGMFS